MWSIWTPPYSELAPAPDGELAGAGGGMDWIWNAGKVSALLDSAGSEPLFVSGCSPNQGAFYPRLKRTVLLTASPDVIRARLATRTTNDFGRDPDELERTLQIIEEIEPLLRQHADLVLDTRTPLDETIDRLVRLVAT